MQHLVIIDGHHLLYRAYWAIPRTMRNKKGEQVNTAFGFTSMLINILRTEQPDALLFCFDADEQTFRHKEYEGYKAGRAATPDDFYPQVPHVLRVIDSLGLKRVEGGGFEADDFACAYAKAAERQGSKVTIISGDRDLLQLVNDNVRVAVPHKGYQVPEYFGPGEVVKKYGVTPGQIPSYKGLVGDASDNLHGVLGIGPKAAEALLQQYGTLEGVYANLDHIKDAWKTKLEKDRESAFFCERMAQLVCDVPLPLGLDALRLEQLPTQAALDVFADLGFVLLTKRLVALTQEPYGARHFAPAAPTSSLSSQSKVRKQKGSADDASLQLSLL
jgi:DNA polymerase-1